MCIGERAKMSVKFFIILHPRVQKEVFFPENPSFGMSVKPSDLIAYIYPVRVENINLHPAPSRVIR